MNAMDVALICKALGDANRLEIVQMLSDGEKCGCKLLERFEITQPTLSHDEFSGNIVANSYLKFYSLKDLRHSCASLLLAKGIPMKVIQEWLGHSNFSTTANIYAHLDSKSKDLSVQALSNAISIKKNEEVQSSNS